MQEIKIIENFKKEFLTLIENLKAKNVIPNDFHADFSEVPEVEKETQIQKLNMEKKQI